MTELAIEQKNVINLEVMPLVDKTRDLVIKTREDRALIVDEVKSAKELRDRIEEKFHPTENKVAAREMWERALDTEKQFYEPIDKFLEAARLAVKRFDTEEAQKVEREQREAREAEERRLREEQAKRDAEARAAVEAEEKRIKEEFEKAEAVRLENLRIQQAAEQAGNSKVAGIAAKAVVKAETEGRQIKEEGTAKIEEIRQAAEAPLPEAPARFTSAPPVAAKKLVWKARVVNMKKLAESVALDLVPFSVLEVRQAQLNDFAKGYDGKAKIDGLEFYQEASGRL